MADQAPRLPYERRVNDLVGTYRQAQATVAAQIRAALAAGDLERAARRRLALAEILRTLADLGWQTDQQARDLVSSAFGESAQDTATRIGLHLTPVNAATFSGIEREAVLALQDAITGRLDESRATVGRRVNDVFAQAGRRSTMQAVLGAQGSRRKASADLVRQLTDRGIRGFTDRAGREWALDRYAEMAVRTTTRQAVVEGAKARMAAQGIRLARVSTHANPCPVCQPWQGRLVSLDGAVTSYEGESVTDLGAMPAGGPPFHPNCRHTLMPVAEEIAALRRELAVA